MTESTTEQYRVRDVTKDILDCIQEDLEMLPSTKGFRLLVKDTDDLIRNIEDLTEIGIEN